MSQARPLYKVSVADASPLVYVHHHGNGSIHITGPLAALLSILGDKVGFDSEVLFPSDGIHCGSQSPNGSWKGTVGMVARKEAHFSLGPCTVNTRWSDIIDYSVPIDTQSDNLLMRRAEPEHNLGDFLKPFASEVWTYILLSFFSVCVAMSFLSWAEGILTRKPSTRFISRAVIWALQAASQEGSEWLPELSGGRLLVAIWLFATLIFMTSYGGILTAMLTVPTFRIPIDSVKDMVGQTKIPWRLEVGSFMYQLFRDSENEIFQKVYRGSGAMTGGCWTNKDEIRNGDYVAVCIKVMALSAMAWDFGETGKCHMYLAKEAVYQMNLGVMIMQKNFVHRETFDDIILRLHEAGIFNKWLLDEISNVTQCLLPPGSDLGDAAPPALPLTSLHGPFTFLLGGLAIGCVVFAFEQLTELLFVSHKEPED
ncbi:glutamate receptor-like [Palaemon carinicauda]|uniref:glutamate receptor-like n=1 Tax=Palaemon carinicauda TaxID=392227 RepID=UPI0035B62EEB